MSKHTPGPWAAEMPAECSGNRCPRGYINHDQLKSGTGTTVITLAEVGGYGEEQIANLRLIAAAPELLKALKAMCVVYDWVNPNQKTAHEFAAKAIAKAERGGE